MSVIKPTPAFGDCVEDVIRTCFTESYSARNRLSASNASYRLAWAVSSTRKAADNIRRGRENYWGKRGAVFAIASDNYISIWLIDDFVVYFNRIEF
jgi:hypothetical protein